MSDKKLVGAVDPVEQLAAEFHEVYQKEARRQGDVRHKDSYADLSENIKEFDRVLARYVLGRFSMPQADMTPEEANRLVKEKV